MSTEYEISILCDAYFNDGNKTAMKYGKLNRAESDTIKDFLLPQLEIDSDDEEGKAGNVLNKLRCKMTCRVFEARMILSKNKSMTADLCVIPREI